MPKAEFGSAPGRRGGVLKLVQVVVSADVRLRGLAPVGLRNLRCEGVFEDQWQNLCPQESRDALVACRGDVDFVVDVEFYTSWLDEAPSWPNIDLAGESQMSMRVRSAGVGVWSFSYLSSSRLAAYVGGGEMTWLRWAVVVPEWDWLALEAKLQEILSVPTCREEELLDLAPYFQNHE